MSNLRRWLIFVSLSVALLLPPLELTSVSTALPTIVHDLKGEDFIWVTSSYALASTAILPMSASLANVFGRRQALLGALALFLVGSALCGSAHSMPALIAGRTVQGMGGGSIISYVNIILSDMVPLRRRGVIGGIMNLAWSVGAGVGPLVGGLLSTHGQWRWLFYLNIPVAGLAMVMVFFILDFTTPEGDFLQKVFRLDWPGTFVIVASSSSVIIALTWSGVRYSWSSAQVLAPLVVGLVGMVAFFVYEKMVARAPIMPWKIFTNRTTLSGFLQTFINHFISLAIINYLTTYFQACKGASAQRAGIDTLAFSLVLGPVVFLTGLSVSKLKFYRPQSYVGWGFNIVSAGLLSTLSSQSKLSLPIGYSVLVSIGNGLVSAMTSYPVLAPLDVSDASYGWAFLVFCRSFASVIWGVAVGGTILQNRLSSTLPQKFSAQFPKGVSIAYAVIPLIDTLEEPLKSEVTEAFAKSLSLLWKVLAGVGGAGMLTALMMKDVPLHETVDKKWTEKTKDRAQDTEKEVGSVHVDSSDTST
ncbi:MFS general substrate transporter [Hymenopellis radicata]|nr:MFS general substrate transporter [Hymenopellis radicata]